MISETYMYFQNYGINNQEASYRIGQYHKAR